MLSTQSSDRQLLATPSDPELGVRHSSSKKHCLVPLVSVVFLIAVVVGVVFAVKSNDHASASPSSNVEIAIPSSKAPSCPSKSPSQRVVVFWGSEVDGCSEIPSGVTHVIIGFALVKHNVVVPTFQGHKATLLQCISALHSKCISVMGSIGGATNVDEISKVNDPMAFANSALALVEEYGFDGVDIDHEAVGPQDSQRQHHQES